MDHRGVCYILVMNWWILQCGNNDEKTVAKDEVPKGNSG